jgi:hypothetical protein
MTAGLEGLWRAVSLMLLDNGVELLTVKSPHF